MTLRRIGFAGVDAAVLVAIVAVAAWVVRSSWYASHPELLGVAVVVDLTVTAALVHLGLGLVGARLPRWTLLTVVGLGAAIAHVLVPESVAVGVLLALLELGVLGALGWTGLRLVRGSRMRLASGEGLLDAVEASLADALESRVLASTVLLELRLIALAIAGPLRRTPSDEQVVSMHRESAWMWVSGFLVALSLVEIPVLHVILDALVAPVPWLWFVPCLFSAASAYGALWILGDGQALRLHPTRLDEQALQLAVGLRWRARIPWHLVLEARLTSEPSEVDVSVFGAPNVQLTLADEVEVHGLFGMRQRGRAISLQVDDAEGFIQHVGELSSARS